MVKQKVYKANAFISNLDGGNPAGVVLEAHGLTRYQMQKIAREVGFSETAFVMNSKKADFKLMFFTPTDEVDLCGHATIAAFSLLRDIGIIKRGKFTQETKSGVLEIEVSSEAIYMEQKLPVFSEIVTGGEIFDAFTVRGEHFLREKLPIQIISTGLRDIFIPVKNLDRLNTLQPDYEKIASLCRRYNAIGIHAFTLETKQGATAHTRNFAPLVGIKEESATGTANGALACYIHKYVNSNLLNYTMEQGYAMGKPSEVTVKLKVFRDSIVKVMVGGKAKIV